MVIILCVCVCYLYTALIYFIRRYSSQRNRRFISKLSLKSRYSNHNDKPECETRLETIYFSMSSLSTFLVTIISLTSFLCHYHSYTCHHDSNVKIIISSFHSCHPVSKYPHSYVVILILGISTHSNVILFQISNILIPMSWFLFLSSFQCHFPFHPDSRNDSSCNRWSWQTHSSCSGDSFKRSSIWSNKRLHIKKSKGEWYQLQWIL